MPEAGLESGLGLVGGGGRGAGVCVGTVVKGSSVAAGVVDMEGCRELASGL